MRCFVQGGGGGGGAKSLEMYCSWMYRAPGWQICVRCIVHGCIELQGGKSV